MATVIVEVPGEYDRIACSECRCEVHVVSNRELIARHPSNGGVDHVIASYRRRGEFERPVHAPEDYECRCHETARRFLINPYE